MVVSWSFAFSSQLLWLASSQWTRCLKWFCQYSTNGWMQWRCGGRRRRNPSQPKTRTNDGWEIWNWLNGVRVVCFRNIWKWVNIKWRNQFGMNSCGIKKKCFLPVLQYGFVTIFVAAFPLAPFFALLNNILEMRLDAQKLLSFYRRPVTQRVRNIGVWYRILDSIGKLSVITNVSTANRTIWFENNRKTSGSIHRGSSLLLHQTSYLDWFIVCK